MKNLLYIFLGLSLIFGCSDDSDENVNQIFLQKYNNVVFNFNIDSYKLWFSDGIIYTKYDGEQCNTPIPTEGTLSIPEGEYVFEYGTGDVIYAIVSQTEDELVLQIQVGNDPFCEMNTWFNNWTFTVSGNSLTLEAKELSNCTPTEFSLYFENLSMTTENIPGC
jgi:hypothetical protein